MYPLNHDHHPPSNWVTPNGVGKCQGHSLELPADAKSPSQSRLRRASSPKGRAKGRAMPARRTEISAHVIRFHSPAIKSDLLHFQKAPQKRHPL